MYPNVYYDGPFIQNFLSNSGSYFLSNYFIILENQVRFLSVCIFIYFFRSRLMTLNMTLSVHMSVDLSVLNYFLKILEMRFLDFKPHIWDHDLLIVLPV